jgi:CheY-like chemotaxis protein
MRKKIVIVDDDPDVCRPLSEFLRLKGHQVDAYTFREAEIGGISAGRFDLALLDASPPGPAGWNLYHALRAGTQTARLPIILLGDSTLQAVPAGPMGAASAATVCLPKPLDLTLLHDTVRRLLRPCNPEAGPSPHQALAGTLTERALPELIHQLYLAKATGLLHLEREGIKKVVYIKDGSPIFIRSNLLRECLGKMLVRENLVSADQSEEALRRAKESGRLHGAVLVEMGLLTPHQLHLALGRQATAMLLVAFGWNDGSFRFLPSRDFKPGLATIEGSPAALILEGFRRYISDSRVAVLLAPHRDGYLLQTEPPPYPYSELHITGREAEILTLCRGNLTLSQLLDRYPLSRYEIEQLVAALLVTGLLASLPDPVAGATRPLTAGETGRLQDSVLADFERLLPLDYFALFGVPQDAPAEDIRRQYFALAKKFHPDRFQQMHLSAEARKKINTLFQRLGEAYRVLSHAATRKEYTDRLGGRGAPPQFDVADLLQAETAFRKGLTCLRSQNYGEAREAFGWAARLDPTEPEYLTYFAWAKFKTAPTDPQQRAQVLATLEQALGLGPKLDRTHLFLGYVLQEEGRAEEAEKRFELALKLNPKCTEAQRELRLINLRRGQSGGIIDWMFKKK